MAHKLNKKEKNTLNQIASFYGCKVKFTDDVGGFFGGDYIVVGIKNSRYNTKSRIISTFCHELAHFINWKTGKYPIYHNPKNFNKYGSFFRSHTLLVRYSLRAEIFTDKVGSSLCKEWFPSVKYKVSYTNSTDSYQFLSGYYLLS